MTHSFLLVLDVYSTSTRTAETHLVEVDSHGAVAHLRRFMIIVSDGWKRHATGSWPHWHAQSIARGLCRRGGVTHHQALSLQHDGLCIVLADDLWGPPADKKQQSSEKDVAGSGVGKSGARWTGHSAKRGRTGECLEALLVFSLQEPV